MNQKKEISIVLERISAYLSTLLLQEKIITADEKDTYKYGFEITIANMINGLIVLSVGLGLNMLAEAILFSGICEFEILLRGVSCRQLYKMFLFFWAYNHSMS